MLLHTIIITSTLILSVIINLIDPEYNLLFTFQLFSLIVLISFFRKNILVITLLIFSAPYLWVPKYYMIDQINISAFSDFQSKSLINKTVILNITFMLGFIIGARKLNEINLQNLEILGKYRNKYFFYIASLFCVGVINFGISGETIITSGGYMKGETNKSTLHEYFIPIFLTTFIFADKSKIFHKKVIWTLLIIYSTKTFLYGGRIEAIQAILLLLFITTRFFKDKLFLLVIIITLGLIFSQVFEIIRVNPLLLIDIPSLLSHLFEIKTTISNQYGDVYQSTLRIVGLVNDDHINPIQRITSFILILFGALLPSDHMPEIYNLVTFRRDIASSAGGGLISGYSYAWLSYPGPLVFGIFIGVIYRVLYNTRNIILIAYALMVASMFPRWYAYYPSVLFKICILSSLIIISYKIIINLHYLNRFKNYAFLRKV